jgi:hypothetical protein
VSHQLHSGFLCTGVTSRGQNCAQVVNTPSSRGLQNSTYGPFRGAEDTHITNKGGKAPIPELELHTQEKVGNRGCESRNSPVSGV